MSDSVKEVNLDVRLEDQDMVDFLMYQTYHSRTGWVAVIFGVIALIVGILTAGKVKQSYTVVYFVLAFVMLIYEPIAVKAQGKRQISTNPVLQNKLHYRFDEKGFTISTDIDLGEGDNKSNTIEWKRIFKAVKTKKALYIYTGLKNASVIPDRALDGVWDDLKKIIIRNVPDHRYKL